MSVNTTFQTGRVVWNSVTAIADGPDADEFPDLVPSNCRVTFTPGVPYIPNLAAPISTVLPPVVTGMLDEDGDLCTVLRTAPGVPAYKGVRLTAQNNPGFSVQGWPWTVVYTFLTETGATISSNIIPSHIIYVKAGEEIDLTTVQKVPASQPIALPAAEAAAGRAVAASLTAEEAVLVVREYAAQIAASGAAASPATVTANGLMASTDKVKLDGIAAGATANSTDTQLRARANHTGTQSVDTISDATVPGKALVRAVDAAAIRSAAGIVEATTATAGLMSPEDKTKLGTATTSANPGTLVSRSAAGGFAASFITLDTDPQSDTAVTRRSWVTSQLASNSTADRARANHTGTQPSSSISDFTEAAQDAFAAMAVAGTGVTMAYNDAGNTFTISTTGGQALDPEAVRDVMGLAIVGMGNINVVVSDAADTITITTTATQNSTDAQLRDRSLHTGTQAISTVTNLQTSLDGKSSTGHTHSTHALKANTPFVTKWNGTAWEYASLAAAVTAGLDTSQIIMFIGHPDGTMPSWARDADIASVG